MKGLPFFCFKKIMRRWCRVTSKTIHLRLLDMNRWRSFKIEIFVRILQILFQIWCSNLMFTKKLEAFIFWLVCSLTGFKLWNSPQNTATQIEAQTWESLCGMDSWIPAWSRKAAARHSSCMFFFSRKIPYQTGKNTWWFWWPFLGWQSILKKWLYSGYPKTVERGNLAEQY